MDNERIATNWRIVEFNRLTGDSPLPVNSLKTGKMATTISMATLKAIRVMSDVSIKN